MRLLLLASVVLFPLAAHAGTITFSVTTVATGTQTQSFTLPDAQVVRAFAAYKAAQGQVCDSSMPPVCSAPTSLQTFQYLALRIVTDITNITRDYEQRQAGAAVTPIQPQ